MKNQIDPDPLLQWNVTATERYLVENWSSVENIAIYLIRRRQVTFEEATQLFDEGEQEGPEQRPFGKLGASGWDPLYKEVKWRIRYPNGIQDVLKEHGL